MYLKRLEIQGFKTFATRTVLEFRPGITAIVGPNGSGKCVIGTTPVVLADGREALIRDLVDAALSEAHHIDTLDDGVVTRENPHNVQVLSMHPATLRLEARPVAAFIKREAPPGLLRVRTRSGREVTATPYHPFFGLDGARLRVLRAEELHVGARIAVPRRLPGAVSLDAAPDAPAPGRDIDWDAIVGIEQISAPDRWVYDLSVAETHNFVAGRIVVHNSNIADAVRWVLGEQSYAVLRSKRTEDLIYGGGGRRAPAGLAEVALTIDNSDRLLPLPYGEVTISRRATRAGENEYFINRTRVRLRDIQEAIAPLGSSYTIVNQGLVDAALTLRPEERRRLFEDAAAISAFEARKADAGRQLRETATNMERCADMLAGLEPRLRALKRQASLARTYRDLSIELRGLLLRHYAGHWRAARQALAAAEAAERHLEAELAARRAAQAAAAGARRAVREQLRAVRERLGVLHAESSALHARAEAVQRDLAVGAERLAALDQRATDLDRGQHDLDLRCEELVREQAAIAGRLEASMEYLAGQRAAVAACEEQLAAREDQRRAAQQALEAAQRAELEAGAAIAERRQRAGQLARQRERLAHEHAGHAAALSAAEAGLAAQRASLAAAEERATAAEQARAAALEAARRAREHLDALRAERARADEALAQAQRALADAEARLETLSRLQRSYAGAFAGVRAAMQWAEANKRAGFALVSSLIRTPPHLETALEVALGSRLQHIVVERWSDAEEAIAALKHGGQGRATFLPLDTIRPPAGDRRPPTGDGVLGVAAELVEYAERYAAVVWMLLGRTLVVRDLPVARQVLAMLRRSAASSASGWTIVTLAGDQVSSGGAVTGGAQIREGGTLRRERELRELPQQIDAQRQAVATALEGRAALDERIAAARRALEEAEAAQQQATQAHEAARAAHEQARRAVERAEADLAWQRRRHAQAAAELADLEAQAAALHDELDALTARWHDAHAQLSQLREEEQARAADEQDVRRRLADLRAALAAAEGETRADRALLQACEQNLARLDEQRTSAAQRRAELAQERARQEAQVHALGTEHAALLARIDELRAQIDPAESELMALEANLSELERRESEATAALLESESAHGRAAVETQRAHDQLDTLRARATADDIDIAALPADDDAVDPAEAERLDAAIQTLKTKIQRLGPVNPLALEEYEQEAAHHAFLTTQLDDLRRAETALRELIAELDEAMQARFETTFHAVAAEFERSFTRLFGGGQAQLLLTHTNGLGASTDGIERLGVDIVARPPGKRQQTLSLLSGGERSLTAAALLFAILRVHPSPFCILDEVDAALDEANVGRFREVLVDLSRQTQFVLITHNRGTIEAADTIYGVSLDEDGVSKVLSLRMEQLVE